jgi:hypothetical protein
MNADDAGAAAFIVCTTVEPAGQGARRLCSDAARSVARGCRCERTQKTDVLSGMIRPIHLRLPEQNPAPARRRSAPGPAG